MQFEIPLENHLYYTFCYYSRITWLLVVVICKSHTVVSFAFLLFFFFTFLILLRTRGYWWNNLTSQIGKVKLSTSRFIIRHSRQVFLAVAWVNKSSYGVSNSIYSYLAHIFWMKKVLLARGFKSTVV